LTEEVTTAQARKSTLIVAAVFAVLSGLQWYRGRPLVAEVCGIAAALLLVCAMIPPAAVWFFKRWLAIAAALGYVNTRILLSLFFYLVITPAGNILRLFGHDAMDRRSKTKKKSYWQPRQRMRQSREEFERAF